MSAVTVDCGLDQKNGENICEVSRIIGNECNVHSRISEKTRKSLEELIISRKLCNQ